MVEESQVVIFPPLKISELERDVQMKRLSLQTNKNELKAAIHKKLRPVHFLKGNKKFLIGAFLALFPFAKLMAGIFSPKQKKELKKSDEKPSRWGWLWKFLGFLSFGYSVSSRLLGVVESFVGGF